MYATRCSLTEPNQCESFINHTIDNLCLNMANPQLMGYRYLSNFKPPVKCPLKPGVVDVSGGDIIVDRLLKLPVEGFGWTLKGMFFGRQSMNESKQVVGCIMAHMRILKSVRKQERAYII